MAAPHYSIEVRDIRDGEACLRGMHREARGLASRYATMTAFHFGLAADDGQYEAHIDIHFPQHQVLVNTGATTAEGALRDVLAKAAGELARVAVRDPSIAPSRQAITA